MYKKGFTLSETLVTLSILGVVAALTIPNLVHKFQDRMQITGLKKATAILDNAMQLAIVEHGTLDKWDWPGGDVTNDGFYMGKMLKSYFNIQKFCEYSPRKYDLECASYANGNSDNFKYNNNAYHLLLNGNMQTGAAILNRNSGFTVLKNNMMFSYRPLFARGCATTYDSATKKWVGSGEYIGTILVDTNGKKGPNRYGYDVFELNFGKNGLLISEYRGCPMEGYINGKASSDCLNPQGKGLRCSTWVLKYNNMNYKYRDVSSEW